MSRIERRRNFIINAAYFAVIVGIVFIIFRYLLNLIWPFFVAFLFAWLLSPAIRWLTVKCHIRHNISAAICLIVFFALMCGLVVLVSARVISGAGQLINWLSRLYGDIVGPGLETLSASLSDLAERLSPELAEMLESTLPTAISSIGSAVTNLSMRLVAILSGTASRVPTRLLSALICVIATIFMTADFPRITSFLLRQLPDRPRAIVGEGKESLKTVIWKYGRSYGIIMGITFVEMLLGMLILRQEKAVLIALAIAVFDIFPIVGAGLILIPWGIICLLAGSIGKGIGLLVIYVVEIIVRQIIEPRIVGRQVGLHPVITLIAMFVGSKLFGGIGLLGLPISCAIVQSLETAGVIHIIKRENAPRAATPDEPTPPPEGSSPIPRASRPETGGKNGP